MAVSASCSYFHDWREELPFEKHLYFLYFNKVAEFLSGSKFQKKKCYSNVFADGSNNHGK